MNKYHVFFLFNFHYQKCRTIYKIPEMEYLYGE